MLDKVHHGVVYDRIVGVLVRQAVDLPLSLEFELTLPPTHLDSLCALHKPAKLRVVTSNIRTKLDLLHRHRNVGL
jgi:hypothetical protein